MMMYIVGALAGSQNLRVKFVVLRIVCVLGQGHRNFLRDVTSGSCNDTLSICDFFCCDFATWNCSPTLVVNFCRKDGQDTADDLRKRDLREELEDRERRHFSSKDRSYGEIIMIPLKPYLFSYFHGDQRWLPSHNAVCLGL